MFVQDVTMDLLEDICHQVLDLYSQPQSTDVPDSPPLLPRHPAAMPEVISAPIPVKVSSDTRIPKNGQDVTDNEMPIPTVTSVKPVSVPTDMNSYKYAGYPAPPMTYPPTFTTPIPSTAHITTGPPPGPPPNVPVYSPYVGPPPHYPSVATAPPPFYQPPPSAGRPYYPPPTQ